ncbi:tyrosine-protein kinase Fyn-like isoform X3 [Oratosquilla oratoria]|uniref:tyrosine-protein kinase Fyn-like isoform X3 n=1 Tax=Oratosquilla oratoria TaxID=337810 RepID=UPI003F776C81
MGNKFCCPPKGTPPQPHPGQFDPIGKMDGNVSMTPPHGVGAGGNPRYYPDPSRSRHAFNSQQHGVDVIRSNSGQGMAGQGWSNMSQGHQGHQGHQRVRKESDICRGKYIALQMHEEMQPVISHQGGRIVVAMYTFNSRSQGEMSFNKGDRMEILNEDDRDWLLAQHLSRNAQGYIPRNYVASMSSPECQDWFFGKISRKHAEKLLMSPGNQRGTFLIRMSEQTSHGYSLSIKDWDQEKGDHVKHYRIKTMDSRSYYITTAQAFHTLNDLVDAYMKNNYGLACLLQYPCPKPMPQLWDITKETKDHWEIERSMLQMTKKLGQGSFGEVWYGMYDNRFEVAVKTLRQGSMSQDAFLEEAKIMKDLRHPNILVLYAVCTKEEPILIVTEYMCQGALLELLRNEESKRTLKLNDLIYISSQVASGMAYLESKQLIHRDLAARNVLVKEALCCKVADFGLARIIEGDSYCAQTISSNPSGNKFPVKWTAPEAMLYNRFTIKSDVWSFGVLLYEIITYGANPYPGMNNREVIERVQAGHRMGRPPRCPEELYKVMLHSWDKDPDHRPTFEYLHHFFDDFQG